MKTKDICTVDQIDNSTDTTNVIIDESGNLRKVNLKKAVNNFTPPPEKIEQIQQNTNDIEWMRSDISDLKTQVRSLSKENTELRSNKINTLTLEVGVICHKDCRKTLNGARELIVANRIQYLLRNTEYLEAIGAPELSATKQSYNIPYDYNAYIVSVTIDYFESM